MTPETLQGSTVANATNATNADYAKKAGEANLALNANSAAYATNAGYANSSNYSDSARVAGSLGGAGNLYITSAFSTMLVGNYEGYRGLTFHPGNLIHNIGVPSNPVQNVFVRGIIETSDERLKSVVAYDERLFNAWARVQFTQYQWKERIEQEGIDKARIHSGYIAQQIKQSFEEEGLDPFRYGLLCYDEWEDEDAQEHEKQFSAMEHPPIIRKAGNIYALNYSECLCIEAAYQRWQAKKLEDRIAKLEQLVLDSK